MMPDERLVILLISNMDTIILLIIAAAIFLDSRIANYGRSIVYVEV